MQDFKTLAVWQKSHALTLEIYRESQSFPREEMFGLTSQMRRAAASVPTNIAEGCGRSSRADKARFFVIAFGSASELEYHAILARDLEFLQPDKAAELIGRIEEIKRMLSGLIKKVSPQPEN